MGSLWEKGGWGLDEETLGKTKLETGLNFIQPSQYPHGNTGYTEDPE